MTAAKKSEPGTTAREVSIGIGGTVLQGTMCIPADAKGIVLFAHGSGSSRHSPRNRYVAGVLQSKGMATLLFDLLTREEESVDEETGRLRFDIAFLAKRLAGATRWVRANQDLADMALGYFGASTGAAAALVAAAEPNCEVAAVVSRGGRPDLAKASLGSVQAPTLLIVGGEDQAVIEWNRYALADLRCERKLVIIPRATHLFEEPGALEEVARVAAEWFALHLAAAHPGRPVLVAGH
jgi:dienelactone hydrolase